VKSLTFTIIEDVTGKKLEFPDFRNCIG